MSSNFSLKNHFLLAMPDLGDPHFDNTLTLICDHNEEGAMGIVINRIGDISVDEVLFQFNKNNQYRANHVEQRHTLEGGPVRTEHGFILHRPKGQWTWSLSVGDDLTLTTSEDILIAIADNRGPDDFLIALGYAGWGAGQLEDEIASNTWLTVPADPDIIFHYPTSERRRLAAASIGLKLESLTTHSGQA